MSALDLETSRYELKQFELRITRWLGMLMGMAIFVITLILIFLKYYHLQAESPCNMGSDLFRRAVNGKSGKDELEHA